MANWTKTRSKSKLISILRQFVAYEYDHTKLYSYLPSMRNVTSADTMLHVLIPEYGTEAEVKAFNDLYQKEGDKYMFPVAGTIHNYLKKNDTAWYTSQEAFSDG